jgi:ELWxxDGT repeat protein
MLFRPFADFLSRLRGPFRRAKRIVVSASGCEHLEDRMLLSVDALEVADINPGLANGNPQQLTNVNGTLFFAANDGTSGLELWKSDGSTAGTLKVKDINPGSAGSNPSSLTNVNGTLFFIASDGTGAAELWKSDGTAAGTVLVKDINPGATAALIPSSLTNVGGKLFFAANDGVSGWELWESDGTTAGTSEVKDINAGASGAYPSSLTNVNGTLYFSADDGVTGRELWKSDGSAAGTVEVQDIKAGTNGSFPNSLTNVGGTLFFTAAATAGNYGLWKSDGSASGTVMVKNIGGGTGSYAPKYLTDVNGTLFFGAQDKSGNNELWKSDGTSVGTVQLKSFPEGGQNPYPLIGLTNVNGTLFFTATTTIGDYELWKSDGTSVGTVRVKDISAGTTGSFPINLSNINGVLYFSANDGVAGRELWTSNGTSAGTFLVQDIMPGASGSVPGALTDVNGQLFFVANDGTTGVELWHLVNNNVNGAPVDIELSSTSIAENNAANAVVGTLSASDPDIGDTFTFSLVDGTGSADNGSFSIVGNSLQITPSADFETKSSYSILVQVTDQGGLSFQKQLTIGVTPVNESPTNIVLSSSTIAENNSTNAIVGVLSAIDPDVSNTFTYTLVAGTGSTDNSSFSISGSNLLITPSTNYEAKSSYSVRVRVTDQGGLTFEKVFPISVSNVNEAPTNVALSATSLTEHNLANAVVGTLSAVDPDAGNTFTYSLVTGTGSTDNGSFSITGNTLNIIPVTNAATQSSYAIRVRVTDQDGLSFEKPFTIGIVQEDAAPTNLSLSATSLAENNLANAVVGTLSTTDPDASNTFTYSLVTGTGSTDNTSFAITGNTLTIIPSADYETKNSYSIRIRTTDQGGLTFEKQFTIAITNVDDLPTVITLNSQPLVRTTPKKVAAIDSGATISDGDTPTLAFAGSVLQISGSASKDTLSILKQGGISTKGKNVLLGKTVIGTVSGGAKGQPLTIHLNAAATQTSVQLLLRSVAFKSTDKSVATRTIHMQITNIAGKDTNQATRSIQIGH